MLCLWNKFLLQACWSRALSYLGKGHFRLSLQNCLGKRGKKLQHYWAATVVAATAAAPTTAHNGHPSSFQAPCAAKQPFVADIRFHLLTGWRNYWRNSAMGSAHHNRCFPCLLQTRSSIQCLGSMIFWGGSGSGSFYFLHLHLHHFSKKKSLKESQNIRNQGCSYSFFMMMEGSGSGSESIPLTSRSGSGSWRPKNMWIRIRLRIRNTASITWSWRQQGQSFRSWKQKVWCTARMLLCCTCWRRLRALEGLII